MAARRLRYGAMIYKKQITGILLFLCSFALHAKNIDCMFVTIEQSRSNGDQYFWDEVRETSIVDLKTATYVNNLDGRRRATNSTRWLLGYRFNDSSNFSLLGDFNEFLEVHTEGASYEDARGKYRATLTSNLGEGITNIFRGNCVIK